MVNDEGETVTLLASLLVSVTKVSLAAAEGKVMVSVPKSPGAKVAEETWIPLLPVTVTLEVA